MPFVGYNPGPSNNEFIDNYIGKFSDGRRGDKEYLKLSGIRRHHPGKRIRDLNHAELLERIPLPGSLIIHSRFLLDGHRDGRWVVKDRRVSCCRLRTESGSTRPSPISHTRPGFSARLQGDNTAANWYLYISTCSFHDQFRISIHPTGFSMYFCKVPATAVP